ncbi:hypothetical protein [Rhizobium laguerreae]|nr:hypothetical protein [Rhizobium laguerreae]MBY3221296.1 hypothetical protein [Rhizobium laguerreae]
MKAPRVFSDARRCKKIFKKKTALADPGRLAKAVFTAPRVFSDAQRTL